MEENELKENESSSVETNQLTEDSSNASEETKAKCKCKKTLILGIIAAVVLVAGGAVGAFFGLGMNVARATEWVKDYEAVQETAKNRNKNILLVFTGVEWDNISGDFEKNIMQDKEFIKKMGKKFELAHIDIPASESSIPEEEMQQIFTYAMMYGLETTPSFILLNSECKSYGTVAFTEDMGLEAVIEAIVAAETSYKDLIKLKASIGKAKGIKKVELIDTLYENSSDEEKAELMDYILEIPTLDPENESGLLGKYKLLAAYNEAGLYMQRGDVLSARDLLVRVAEDPVVDSKYSQEAFYTAAYVSALGGLTVTQEEIDYVCTLIEKAINAYPESEHIQDLNHFLELVKSQTPAPAEVDEVPAK
ncbi:MAG: thioredoxin family protein [Treponema sp.]|nr:thioredoxin family protein [Treponema sp.]